MANDSKIQVRPNTSRVMMSDVLKGSIPDIEDDVPDAGQQGTQHVVVIAAKRAANKPEPTPIVGILRGVMFGVDPQVEFRVQLSDALDIIEQPNVSFDGFELHHGERIIKMPGPFLITAARIDEIIVQDQMCTLGLHLKKPAR